MPAVQNPVARQGAMAGLGKSGRRYRSGRREHQSGHDCGIHPECGGKVQPAYAGHGSLPLDACFRELEKDRVDARDKNRVKLIRPSDIMQIEPLVQECFDRELFYWGNNPCLRWSVNNTKRVRSSRSIGVDTGNFIYAKIEAKSRKNDPFMALVASMVCEPALGTGQPLELPPIGAIRL